jgi:small-conductance mechanosensitive channel
MANLKLMVAPQPIDDLDGWLASFTQPTVAFEVVALLVSAALAWVLVASLRRRLEVDDQRSVWFGKRTIDGVLFPLALLVLGYLSLESLNRFMPIAVLRIAIPVLMSLLVIRVGVKVLQATFEQARWVKPLEQTISWGAWLAMVLWVSGLLPVILNELSDITWTVGGSSLSLRNLIEGVLTGGAVLIITLWISSGIESRLLRSAKGAELSLRKAVSNASRALLMFVGLMFAMSAVGIDLTALSVLGGAIGVGIGFGLQKLAANYVSGFVILAERSMRIGDMVRVDNFEGTITEINARYTVVRSPTGRESIVPNEILITSRVENWSLADPRVHQSTAIAVGYNSDVDVVMDILVSAALAQPRVLRDPGPAAMLVNFGADGLEFSLGYWIADIENGQGNLRSDINLRVLRELRAHGIDIPYPQRVIHTKA